MVRNVTRIFGVHLHCLSCVRGAFLALASNDGSYCHCLRDVVILAGLRKSRHVVWLQNNFGKWNERDDCDCNAPEIRFLLQSRKPPWVRLVCTAAPAKLALVYNSFSFGNYLFPVAARNLLISISNRGTLKREGCSIFRRAVVERGRIEPCSFRISDLGDEAGRHLLRHNTLRRPYLTMLCFRRPDLPDNRKNERRHHEPYYTLCLPPSLSSHSTPINTNIRTSHHHSTTLFWPICLCTCTVLRSPTANVLWIHCRRAHP